MAYLIKMMPRAEHDLAHIYKQIHAEHSGVAMEWYRGLKRAILNLEENPNRCPATPENKKLRQLFHGRKPHTYRVIYRIADKQKEVHVLHIRHGAMDRFES